VERRFVPWRQAAGAPARADAQVWRAPLLWQRQDAGARVWCVRADLCDPAIPAAWRDEVWALVRGTPQLRWHIATGRTGPLGGVLPADWGAGWAHVALGAVAEDADAARRGFAALRSVPARARFLFCPAECRMLDLAGAGWDLCPRCEGAGAVEAGGSAACLLCEACLGSGHAARPCVEAVFCAPGAHGTANLERQCMAAGVGFELCDAG